MLNRKEDTERLIRLEVQNEQQTKALEDIKETLSGQPTRKEFEDLKYDFQFEIKREQDKKDKKFNFRVALLSAIAVLVTGIPTAVQVWIQLLALHAKGH